MIMQHTKKLEHLSVEVVDIYCQPGPERFQIPLARIGPYLTEVKDFNLKLFHIALVAKDILEAMKQRLAERLEGLEISLQQPVALPPSKRQRHID